MVVRVVVRVVVRSVATSSMFTRRIGEPFRHEACGDGPEQLVADGRRVDLVRVRARVSVALALG